MRKLTIMFLSFCSLSACSKTSGANTQECFQHAALTQAYMKQHEAQIVDKLFAVNDDMFIAYNEGRLKYPPIGGNLGISYGGTCTQTKAFDQQLAEDHNITKLTKAEYIETYVKSGGQAADISTGTEL